MAKTAIIFGSTGLVGSALLKILIQSDEYETIKAFVRKPVSTSHKKLQQILIDFDQPESYDTQVTGDDIYLCLGTTMKKAGSKDAFYKIDYTYTLQAASAAAKNQVKKLCLISSLGADASSAVYYSKVKGEVERDISMFGFEAIHIVRPSLLLGNRKENRVGERVGILLSSMLSFLFVGPLKKYKAIQDITVATAMYRLMQSDTKGTIIHESIELQKFG
jgi:uncharacterized protein YbjT (DUF2867 family)